MAKQLNLAVTDSNFFPGNALSLLKQTFQEWLQDKAPQLAAALAYYVVFSLAPLVLVLLAIVGVIFRDDPAGAWSKLTLQMSYFLDQSAVQTVQKIAETASQPGKSTIATIIGIALALFGASGVFGQLQDALNTIWGVKATPARGLWGFLRTRFLSFAMVGGICFLLLVSLAIEALLKSFSHYVQSALPGGLVVALAVYLVFDFAVVVLLFAMIFQVSAGRQNSMARRLDWCRHHCDPLWHREMAVGILPGQRRCGVSLWSSEFANYIVTSGFTIRRKSSYSALNSPRCMPRELAVHLNRLSTQFALK